MELLGLTLFENFQVVEFQQVVSVIKVGHVNLLPWGFGILHPRAFSPAVAVVGDRLRDGGQSVFAFSCRTESEEAKC